MIRAATMNWKEKKTEGRKVEQTGTDQLRVNKHAGKLSGGDDESKNWGGVLGPNHDVRK